jgi:hypothetical protein
MKVRPRILITEIFSVIRPVCLKPALLAEIFSAISCWTPPKGHIDRVFRELTENFSANSSELSKKRLATEIFSVIASHAAFA